MIQEFADWLVYSFFGLKVTLSGILLEVIGGFVLGHMRLAPYLSDLVKQIHLLYLPYRCMTMQQVSCQ